MRMFTNLSYVRVFTVFTLFYAFTCERQHHQLDKATFEPKTVDGLQDVRGEDPNIRFLCKGALNDFTACLCNDADINNVEVACINAQFVDTSVIQHLNQHYLNARQITFHGNNFQDLPEKTPLFGVGDGAAFIVYDQLRTLNLSANYIVNLHAKALLATPNIQVLDLNNNEIVLSPENVHFLDYTPHITHLYLRKAFASAINRTNQFNLMMEMFINAKLEELRLIDMSYNYLTSVPYNLACPFPSLQTIDLRQNMFQTMKLDSSCLKNIKLIDLSRNHFQRLDHSFRTSFADTLPPNTLLLRNSFTCDCKSAAYIQWIRTTNKIREKNLLTCARSSPENFAGTRLLEVPLHRLDCNTNFNVANSANSLQRILFTFFSHLITACLF